MLKLIILHLCVNVHCHLAVLMPCKMLDRFGIHSGMDQVGNIRVAKQMWRHQKVDSIHNKAIIVVRNLTIAITPTHITLPHDQSRGKPSALTLIFPLSVFSLLHSHLPL